MPTWTFVRHGQSIANAEGWLAGTLDAPLTARGESEAVAAREPVGRRPFTRAFCSDLSRAHRTAQLLLHDRDVPLVVTPRLRERDCGAWVRRTVAELDLHPAREARLTAWRGRPPRGESLLDTALRAIGWLSSVDDSADDTLVVAHGALILSVLVVLDEVPRASIDRWRPANCEAVDRVVPQGGWAAVLDRVRDEAAGPPPDRPG